MYGSFIVKGDFQLIPNFLTNNLGTGHVYRNRATSRKYSPKVYIVNLKRGNVLAQVKYDPSKEVHFEVTTADESYSAKEAKKGKLDRDHEISADLGVCRKIRKINKFDYTPNLEDKSKSVSWIDMMNESSPLPEHVFDESAYKEHFDACLQHAPELDHLVNKKIISPSTQLERVLVHLVKLCEVLVHTQDSRKLVMDKKKFIALSNKLKTVFSN